MSRELYEMAWQYGEFKDSPDDDETMDWAAARIRELEAQLTAAQEREAQLNFSNATITELRGQLEKMAAERDSLKQQLAAAQEQNLVLARGILSVQNLINESRGVDGYLMNGDIAEWDALLDDGCILDEYSKALHLIHKTTTDSLREQSDFALITKMESDVADADEKIASLEAQLTAAQEREAQLNFSNATITELRGQLEKMAAERDSLKQQLVAAQERGVALNNDLYYALELVIAYAHSAADQEWASKRIDELKPPERELPAPPEQEAADESV